MRFVLLALVGIVVGCSGGGGGGGGGGGEGGSGGSGGSGGAGGSGGGAAGVGACDGPLFGPGVTGQKVAQTAPTLSSAGGSLDGTWQLTAIKCFTGPTGGTGSTGVTVKESWRFSGTNYWNSFVNGNNEETSASGTIDLDTVNGAFQRQQTCPTTRTALTDRYGFDQGQLVVEAVDCGETGSKELYYFTKQ